MVEIVIPNGTDGQIFRVWLMDYILKLCFKTDYELLFVYK